VISNLKRAGSNFKGLSPFSEERSPSFMVSPAKEFGRF
jgi:DNA primase